MPEENADPIVVDLAPPESVYRHDVHWRILRDRERTANTVALILVLGLVFSLPLYLLAVLIRPDVGDKLANIIDKWYVIVSPLAGAAIGAYYGSRMIGGGKGGK